MQFMANSKSQLVPKMEIEVRLRLREREPERATENVNVCRVQPTS